MFGNKNNSEKMLFFFFFFFFSYLLPIQFNQNYTLSKKMIKFF